MHKLRWIFTLACGMSALVAAEKPWSQEKAAAWYRAQPWLVGSNYLPSNAINELEMWQADTFDAKRIDMETRLGGGARHEYDARILARSALGSGRRRVSQPHRYIFSPSRTSIIFGRCSFC